MSAFAPAIRTLALALWALVLPPAAAQDARHAPPHGLGDDMIQKDVPVEELPRSGRVREVIQAGEYTFLRVAEDDGEIWLAAPALRASVGERLRFEDAPTSRDFYSRTLRRRFERILFVGQAAVTDR